MQCKEGETTAAASGLTAGPSYAGVLRFSVKV
jgi:hypothetical protein